MQLLQLLLLLLLQLLALLAPSKGARHHEPVAEWSGPALTVRPSASGPPQLLVDGADPSPPLWLVLHVQYTNISILDEQVRRAADAGLRTVCICLTSDVWNPAHHANPWLSDDAPMDNRTRGLFDRIIRLHPKVLFIIRFYAFQPTIHENMVLLNMTDGNATDMAYMNATLRDGALMNSLTLQWEASAADQMTTMLRYLDREYPGRIAGSFPCYLHTSEWFMPGTNDIGLGGKSKLADYSAATEKRYCAETQGGGGGSSNGSCSMPLPSKRNTPGLGSAFADVETTQLNLFFADTVAHAIETLATAAKKVSGGKLMTMSFYGYLMGLADSRLAGSGHLALHRLLRFPDLDAIASPYMYNHLVRNNSEGPLLPHGPWDAAPAHGKVWIVEDDSRTSLASPAPLKFTEDAAGDFNLMRRNVLTSLLRGNIIYFYDLGLVQTQGTLKNTAAFAATQGWFGRPDRPAETDQVWAGVKSALAAVYDTPSASSSSSPASATAAEVDLKPQVAVFVDDVSAATRTVFDDGADFLSSLMHYPPIIIGSIGAPTRVFVLSDLLLPDFDSSEFRMCIFLNAFVVTPELSEAISKLKQGNTTLVWQFAPGLFESAVGPREINTTRISDLVGLPLQRGGTVSSLLTHVPESPTLQKGFPRDYGLPDGGTRTDKKIDPWFQLDSAAAQTSNTAAAVEVLGTLKADPTAAVLVRAQHAGWSAVFSAAPGLPVQLWRALAIHAGVHLFLPNAEACVHNPDAWEVHDAVEVRGRFLMVHASAVCSGAARLPREVRLPRAVGTVVDEANATVCTGCAGFQTAPMRAGEVQLYTLTSIA